ncbi:gliding motility-associated C-terminal domain-containing protein [Persicitalea sp.]|uniref:lectin-like domain-containing protein n=1 Tax=Persicitalea sp. TaxID=3100273 RepID=UPI003594743B
MEFFTPRLRLRLCLSLLLWLTGSRFALCQYNIQGTSVRELGDDCYLITEDASWQKGTIWIKQAISLQTSFSLEFSMNFGNKDLEGADGMVFAFQTQGNTLIGQTGQGIGFGGFSPALGIEFDTHQNLDENDPEFDHIAILRNGIVNHLKSSNLAGPVRAAANQDNIEDGADHLVRISWLAPLKILEVYFDCEKRISVPIDMTAIFGKNEVFWGFTAATGGESNRQTVCVKNDIVWQSTLQICRGESRQLMARNSLDGVYRWSPASAMTGTANVRNPTVRPDKDQLYVVEYRNFCNQLVRDSVMVKVNPLPPLELGPDRTICSDGNGTVLQPNTPNATAAVQYEWTNGATTPSILVSQSGLYGLTMRQEQCVSRDSVYITLGTLPRLPDSYEPPMFTSCLRDEALTLTSVATGDGLTYNWLHSGQEQPSISVDRAGTYEVVVTGSPGCQITESMKVVDACPLSLWIPDAFSPNADGQNDQLMILTSQPAELRFWVYDRWGGVIFFSNKKEAAWDGYYQGQPCLPGAYTWRAEYKLTDQPESQAFTKRGVVWLIR